MEERRPCLKTATIALLVVVIKCLEVMTKLAMATMTEILTMSMAAMMITIAITAMMRTTFMLKIGIWNLENLTVAAMTVVYRDDDDRGDDAAADDDDDVDSADGGSDFEDLWVFCFLYTDRVLTPKPNRLNL